MKRILALLFLVATGAFAQTPPTGTPHSATLSWTAPSPVGGSGTVAGYNVYKSVAGGAYAKINTTPIVGLTTVDSAVTSGQVLSYCATTVDTASEESACSIAVTATIPTNPNPPTIKITVASITVNGTTETVLLKWTDTGTGLGEYFAFTDGTKFLGQGLTSSQTGTFAEELTVAAGTAVTVLACNTAGVCASQAAM